MIPSRYAQALISRRDFFIASIAITRVTLAAPPAKTFDIQAFIENEIAAGVKRVVIPPGTYRVTPMNRRHLTLKNLKNIEIVADGVEMICTETTMAVTIENCTNLTLRGMTIDYDPLPFTQGRITALAPDKSWLEFELFDGYPDDTLVIRIEIFDQITDELKRGTYSSWKPFDYLGSRRYRVAKAEGYSFDPAVDLEEIGDILVTNHDYAPSGQGTHAIVTSHSSGVVLENITIYASNCFSYYENNCDGTIYRNCSINRRLLEQDLRPRGYKRLRSGNADAFHSKHARRGPQIIKCSAKFMGDDAVNICGEYYMIMDSSGSNVRILSLGDINLKVGDPVELVSYTGERIPDARVTGIGKDTGVQEDEIEFLSAQRMRGSNRDRLSQASAKGYLITLDREVDLAMGSVIASMNQMGNNFLVQDCDFGMNRSRGILVKASQGAVINNQLQGNWGNAILVSPEWYWLESGSSNDIEIRGNVIRECRDVGIAVMARGGDGRIAPTGGHNRIRITDNQIHESPYPAVFVSSTKDLTVSGNTLGTPRGWISSWSSRNMGLLESKTPPPLLLTNCEDVSGDNLLSATTIRDMDSE